MFYGMYGELDDSAPTVVSRYRVRYFDLREWDSIDKTLLAESEHQCREWVESQCPLEHRLRDYPEGRKDSLQVFLLSTVVLPYVLSYE